MNSFKYQILSDYPSFLAVLQENTVDQNPNKIIISNLNSVDYDSLEEEGEQEEGEVNLDSGEINKVSSKDLPEPQNQINKLLNYLTQIW